MTITLGVPALSGISGGLLLVVLFGALLHASWNALLKSGTDKPLDTALMQGLGSLMAIPLVMWTGLPEPQAWPWILLSTTIHIAYYQALAGAYRHGDLSLTYPLMRGTAPLLVALASPLLLGDSLSWLAWCGVALVSLGVLVLGLARSQATDTAPGHETRRRKAVRFALLNACIIACYTVVDGLGVRASGNAPAYVAGLFLIDGLPYLALVLWQRRADWPAVAAHCRRRWPLASLGMIASLGSYGIALWAMTRAPVAVVAALRESSVLFAALISTAVLRENFGWQKALGTGVIVAGIVAIRLH